jgi:hypothetical protein
MYPEDEDGLRVGQIETVFIVRDTGEVREEDPFYLDPIPPFYILIKTYLQTDEEAGGRGSFRKVMLVRLEGTEYNHNGELGVYEHVGDCTLAPREYAVRTILIKSPDEIITSLGDWDYEKIQEQFGV